MGRVHATRNVVLRQGKKAFYEGNVLLWRLTGIKSLFDAGRGQKPCEYALKDERTSPLARETGHPREIAGMPCLY